MPDVIRADRARIRDIVGSPNWTPVAWADGFNAVARDVIAMNDHRYRAARSMANARADGARD